MDGMRTKTKVLSLAALLAGSVVFGMILAGSLDLTRLATAQKAVPAPAPTAATAPAPAARPAPGVALALPSFADIAEQIEPAIVSVTATDIVKGGKRRPSYHNFGGEGGQDPFDFFFGPDGPKRKSAERKNIHRWREQIRFMSLGQSAEELKEFFDARLDAAAPPAKGTSVLVLAPTKRRVRKHIDEIRLTIDTTTYLPVQVDWRMPDGSTRVLQLRNVVVNPPISDSLYVVRIPADFKVTTGFSFPGAGISE
jgi:hypothetical protein